MTPSISVTLLLLPQWLKPYSLGSDVELKTNNQVLPRVTHIQILFTIKMAVNTPETTEEHLEHAQ